jgi:hypothetical protein
VILRELKPRFAEKSLEIIWHMAASDMPVCKLKRLFAILCASAPADRLDARTIRAHCATIGPGTTISSLRPVRDTDPPWLNRRHLMLSRFA